MKLCSRLLLFFVDIYAKNVKFRYLNPILPGGNSSNFLCECAPWPLTYRPIPGFIQIRFGSGEILLRWTLFYFIAFCFVCCVHCFFFIFSDFYHASYASTVLTVITCLSVTSRSCTKTAKPRITLTMPYDSPGTLVFRRQKYRRNSNDITPNAGTK